MVRNRLLAFAAIGCIAHFSTSDANAVETTLGLYSLGSGAVAAGQTPPSGLYFTIAGSYSQFASSRTIPFAGTTIAAKLYLPAVVGNVLWVAPADVFGGNLSFGVTSGFGNLTLNANTVGSSNSQTSVQGSGATDTSFRLSLGWKINEAFSHKVSITQWAPTGRYNTGLNPNIGLNRTGTDFSWGASYVHPTSKIELSGTAGFTIEGYNPLTQYRSGNTVHFEQGLSKYFESGFRVGIISYQYVQLTPDTGSVLLGAFRTRSVGLGPSFGYTTVIGGHLVSFTLQATREIAQRNRLRQTNGLFSTTVKF